jgi:hypothetical protein
MAAILMALHYLPWHAGRMNFGVVILESLLALAVGLAGFWKIVLTDSERANIAVKAARIFPGRRLA